MRSRKRRPYVSQMQKCTWTPPQSMGTAADSEVRYAALVRLRIESSLSLSPKRAVANSRTRDEIGSWETGTPGNSEDCPQPQDSVSSAVSDFAVQQRQLCPQQLVPQQALCWELSASGSVTATHTSSPQNAGTAQTLSTNTAHNVTSVMVRLRTEGWWLVMRNLVHSPSSLTCWRASMADSPA